MTAPLSETDHRCGPQTSVPPARPWLVRPSIQLSELDEFGDLY